MKWASCLRPSLPKFLIFAGLGATLFVILAMPALRIRFFPCRTQPVVPNIGDEYQADWCGLWQFGPGFAGLRVRLTFFSLVVLALVLLVLPYLASCAIIHAVKRNPPKP